jgi:hypothetical protein
MSRRSTRLQLYKGKFLDLVLWANAFKPEESTEDIRSKQQPNSQKTLL